MGYIEKSLAANEQLLYRGRFHWLYRVAAWGILLGCVVAAFALYQNDEDATRSLLVSGAVAVAGVILFLSIMVPIWAQDIAVTNQRLIYRRGLVSRLTEELQLPAVEEVRLQQGILGRILGFGRVTVSGTGVEDLRLPALAEPVRLRQMIQEAISLGGLSWRRHEQPPARQPQAVGAIR